jgi:hypothetical protein
MLTTIPTASLASFGHFTFGRRMIGVESNQS